jgi:hypothetical protein
MANAGDVNGDGRQDLIVGAPGRTVAGQQGAGTVYVFSNLPFVSRILRLEGTNAGDGFGTVVAGGGDVNGDGRLDVLVGAPLADVDGRQDAGLVQVLSGQDGKVLLNYAGTTPGGQMGSSVAFVGDVTADGNSEIAVGAPLFEMPGVPAVGAAFVMSLVSF